MKNETLFTKFSNNKYLWSMACQYYKDKIGVDHECDDAGVYELTKNDEFRIQAMLLLYKRMVTYRNICLFLIGLLFLTAMFLL